MTFLAAKSFGAQSTLAKQSHSLRTSVQTAERGAADLSGLRDGGGSSRFVKQEQCTAEQSHGPDDTPDVMTAIKSCGELTHYHNRVL